MRKTPPIALLVTLAFALVASVLPAAAVQTRAHHRASAKTAKAARVTHKATSSSSTRQKSGSRSALRTTSRMRSASRAPVQSRRISGYGASKRAHARIREAVARRRRHGRPGPLPTEIVPVRLSIPPPLRGSHESLVHQNQMAEADGLERILDDADLDDRIAHGSLVPVPTSVALHINTDLPENRRYCRPWTAKFLTDLSQAHAGRFGGALEVTSAVRTVAYQRKLRLFNGNAAAADGDIASPHLTGGTIDIAKQGLTAREIGWLRSWLIPLEQAGKIDVEEEFRQSCFHISVYKSYAEQKVVPAKTAPMASASMLAAHGR
jgi:hypothetical protein